MKNNFLSLFKKLFEDRPVLLMVIAVVLLGVGYAIYAGFMVRPSELQVAVHYSAYGETSFYRNKWYYLFSFMALGLVVATVHTGLIIKLFLEERRPLAMLLGYISLSVIALAFIITNSLFRVAFL